jgi:hypothetical protein
MWSRTVLSSRKVGRLKKRERRSAVLDWLATTRRPWLVVLDDITDPEVAAWWPHRHRMGSGHHSTPRGCPED